MGYDVIACVIIFIFVGHLSEKHEEIFALHCLPFDFVGSLLGEPVECDVRACTNFFVFDLVLWLIFSCPASDHLWAGSLIFSYRASDLLWARSLIFSYRASNLLWAKSLIFSYRASDHLSSLFV